MDKTSSSRTDYSVLLDTSVLGMVVHPRLSVAAQGWLDQLLAAEVAVFIPEIADYELRRELLRIDAVESLIRLDQPTEQVDYLPITTEVMRIAASLWAEARRHGRPLAHPEALDGDVILVGQARTIERLGARAIVATDNVRHLARFVDARPWSEIG